MSRNNALGEPKTSIISIETLVANSMMKKNPTGTKNTTQSRGMKRKREDDAINGNVRDILTTATSCSCQESSSEFCYIHGQPVMFEGDPKLLEESKNKKRKYNENMRQDLCQKGQLLLGKPTEDWTPEELADGRLMDNSFNNNSAEEVTSDPEVMTVLDTLEASKTAEASKADSASHDAGEHDSCEDMDISESQTLAGLATQESSTDMTPKEPTELTEKQNLRRKKRAENERRRRQRIKEEKAKNAQLMGADLSNNADPRSVLEKELKLRQKAQIRKRNVREKERILLEKSTEDLTPEELLEVQKIKEKKDRQNQSSKDRYHSLSVEQRREKTARKEALKRRKVAEKSLQKTEEVEAKIGQDDQLLDDSFSRNEDLTPEQLEMVRKIKETKNRRNLYNRNWHSSLTPERKKERVNRWKALRHQKAFKESLQKTEKVKAEIDQDDQLLDDSFSRNSAESKEVTSDPEVMTVLDTLEASKTAEASKADSASHDADEHDSYENMDISKSQTSADLATQESSTIMTPSIISIEIDQSILFPSLVTQIQQLTNERDQYRAETEKVQTESEAKIRTLEKQLKEMEEIKNHARVNWKVADAILAETDKKVRGLEAQLFESTALSTHFQNEHKKLQETNSTLAEKSISFEAKIQVLEHKLEESEAKIQELESMKIQLQGSLEKLQNNHLTSTEELNLLKVEIQVSETELEESLAKIRELEDTKIRAQGLFEKLQNEFETEKSEFQNFKTQTQGEFDELEMKKKELQSELVAERSRSSELEAKVQDLKSELAAAKSQVEDKVLGTSRLQKKVNILKKTVEIQETQITTMNAVRSADVEDATRKLRAKDEEIKQLTIKLQEDSELVNFWQMETQLGKYCVEVRKLGEEKQGPPKNQTTSKYAKKRRFD